MFHGWFDGLLNGTVCFRQCAGPRGSTASPAGAPEAPRLELMEQDSKDSAQSTSTSCSLEVQPEYNVRRERSKPSWFPTKGRFCVFVFWVGAG